MFPIKNGLQEGDALF